MTAASDGPTWESIEAALNRGRDGSPDYRTFVDKPIETLDSDDARFLAECYGTLQRTRPALLPAVVKRLTAEGQARLARQ